MINIHVFGGLSSAGPRPKPPIVLTVTDDVMKFTQNELRRLSGGIRESMLVWAGRAHRSGAVITHVIDLEVDAHYARLTVPTGSRAELATFCRREGLLVFADLHTHPGEAFLSHADRVQPFSTRIGFYAIVIPRFARGPVGAGWRYYESTGRDWKEVIHHDRISSQPI